MPILILNRLLKMSIGSRNSLVLSKMLQIVSVFEKLVKDFNYKLQRSRVIARETKKHKRGAN